MKERIYLEVKFLKNGFAIFLMNMHRMLLFALLSLLTCLPILTIGGSLLSLSDCIREITLDGTLNIKYYFTRFKKNFFIGIPYTIIIVLAVISLSLAPQMTFLYCALMFGIILMIFLTLFYPMAAFNQSKFINIMRISFTYTLSHIMQSLMIVSLALIFLVLIAFTSELLLIIFFPIWYFIMNRIVIANNLDIEEIEKNKIKKENL